MIWQDWTVYLTSGIEIVAGAIIAIAALRAGARSLAMLFQRQASLHDKDQVRIQLSGWLALGLEFEVAADILRTTRAPSWNSLGLLAALIALRTALNYVLQRDIDRAGTREDASS